jgi:peptidoglycan/xylan/chitin deacetylase (PgdA/CDA1 family)
MEERQRSRSGKKRGKRPKLRGYQVFVLAIIGICIIIGTGFSVKLANRDVVRATNAAYAKAIQALGKQEQATLVTQGQAVVLSQKESENNPQLFLAPPELKTNKEVQQLMQTSAKKGTVRNFLNKHLTVTTATVQAINEKVARYTVQTRSYEWSKKHGMQKTATQAEKKLYLETGNHQKVTFKELTKADDSNVLAIQQVIEQQLLNEVKNDSTKKLEDVLNVIPVTENTAIQYEPNQVTVSLPQNKLDKKSVTLAYKDIQSYIDTSLVDPASLTPSATQSGNGKTIALTFDDGPNDSTTPQILDILAQNQVKGTFFMLGEMVDKHPEIAKRVVDAGNQVGSHTYNHKYLGNLSDSDLKTEVNLADAAIYKATGVLPKVIRPPYGAITEKGARVAGKAVIQWDIDSLDWKSNNAKAVLETVGKELQDGGIILMHDIHKDTVQALPTLIPSLKAQGYQFVTIDQLFDNQVKPLYQYFGKTDSRLVK